METVRIQTTQNVGIAYEIAGVGDRLVALILDYLILVAWLIAAVIVGGAVLGLSYGLMALIGLPYLLYFPSCHIFLDGQTIGKKARHIKVARLDGGPPTVGNYLVRWLFRLVEVDLSFGLVALVGILISDKGQRFGDMAAGTTVVRVKARTDLRDTVFAEIEDAYEPVFPQAELLTAGDVTMAKEVMAAMRAEGVTVESRDLGAQMKMALEAKMGVESDLRAYDFLKTTVRDYNAVNGRLTGL